MKLLTKELRRQLPQLNTEDDTSLGDEMVIVKFFTPDAQWTWYATEFDGVDVFFGLVDGFEREFGTFSLQELSTLRGPLGLPIERDMYWTPKTLRQIAPEKFAYENAVAE